MGRQCEIDNKMTVIKKQKGTRVAQVLWRGGRVSVADSGQFFSCEGSSQLEPNEDKDQGERHCTSQGPGVEMSSACQQG